MNKSKSKYFRTAQRMDEALLSLLLEKDFEYITVKDVSNAVVKGKCEILLMQAKI